MVLRYLAPAISGALWAAAASRRAPEGARSTAARGLLGGILACAAALAGYAVLERAGVHLSWSTLTAGGPGSVGAAAAIGLVEEGAKLLGLSLPSPPDRAPAAIARRVLLVSAAFSALECALTLGGADAPVLLLRALLAPVAHAALAVPLGVALAAGARARGVLAGLALAAALHGASDLALALPGPGRLGYAALLAAPAVALFALGRVQRARPEARSP